LVKFTKLIFESDADQPSLSLHMDSDDSPDDARVSARARATRVHAR